MASRRAVKGKGQVDRAPGAAAGMGDSSVGETGTVGGGETEVPSTEAVGLAPEAEAGIGDAGVVDVGEGDGGEAGLPQLDAVGSAPEAETGLEDASVRDVGEGDGGEAGLPRSDVVGYVEEILEAGGRRLVKGWAFDQARPDRQVILVAELDGAPVADVPCTLVRPDLVANGILRADCGFLWAISEVFLDGQPHRLAFRTAGDTALESLGELTMDWRAVEAVAEEAPLQAKTVELAYGVSEDVLAHASRLFDPAYYLNEYPDAVAPGEDPWVHFLVAGAAAGHNPNLLFDTAYYLRMGPDVAAAGLNPLLHYVAMGRAEGRRFHWLFDVVQYRRLNPDLTGEGDLLLHMLDHGLAENRQPHCLFHPGYYFATYPDVAASGQSAFGHFLRSGDREGRSPNPIFDPAHYRLQIGKPTQAGPGDAGALEEYMASGGDADPHALFDTDFYRAGGADWAGPETPLQHYVEVGGAAGRDPHPLFDTAYYLKHSGDVAARWCPLWHYLAQGRARGLSPNGLFEPGYYGGQSVARSWEGRRLPRTGPRISVIVPVYNTPPGVLQECIESVLRQSYANWELSIVDDGSRDPGTAAMLARYRGVDARIRIDRSTANLHIAMATNRAVMQASGEFIAFLDHDDVLEPEALAEVAAAAMADPEIDLLYTDEDKLDENGVRRDSYHKPGWSPDHLNSVMYVLHMLTVRKSLFWAVGGSRPERTGAQDYDLALRLAPRARKVHHIPRVLYHWRMLSGSAAAEVEAKPYAIEAGRAALQDSLDAAGMDATVADGLLRGTFRVRKRLSDAPAVSLLILTHDIERELEGRGRVNLVRNFLRSIAEKSTYKAAEIVVVDDFNSSAETKALVEEVGGRIVSYRSPGAFNYAHKANFSVAAAETENVIILNDDLEVITPDWIEALLELSTQEKVGGVGARLLYPSGRVQHAGMILGVNGSTAHAFVNMERDVVGYNAYTHVIRNYSAVTGAVFATRRSVLEEVGGFDERFAIDYNDVDLCLRIGETGRRIVYTPFCELLHFEGSSAKRTVQNEAERALFISRWQGLIDRDPFYNPNLPRDRTGFA